MNNQMIFAVTITLPRLRTPVPNAPPVAPDPIEIEQREPSAHRLPIPPAVW